MGETPDWGTPETPELLRVPEFVMRERAGGLLSDGLYELLATDETPLGAVTKVPGSGNWLFGSSTRTFVLGDATGVPLATMSQPSTWGRSRFLVSAADGREIGTLEQENSFLAPRLVMIANDGTGARLSGGGFGSGGVRSLTDAADRPVGEVSKQFGWGSFFAGTDIYLVRLGAELTGDLRLLAIVATACIDLILNERKRRNNSSTFGAGT